MLFTTHTSRCGLETKCKSVLTSSDRNYWQQVITMNSRHAKSWNLEGVLNIRIHSLEGGKWTKIWPPSQPWPNPVTGKEFLTPPQYQLTKALSYLIIPTPIKSRHPGTTAAEAGLNTSDIGQLGMKWSPVTGVTIHPSSATTRAWCSFH